MSQEARIGPFRILDHLATGGMGSVFFARHDDGSSAAVKLLRTADEVTAHLFIREVQATARLHHDNIVAVLDYGVLPDGMQIEDLGPGTPYYFMEFVPGGSFGPAPPVSWEELERVLATTLEALAHAHARGVIHRDIKPDNMLRADDGGVVLTDFGVAHAMFTHTSTLSDDLTTGTHENASGTPLYMAPEQFVGAWRDYGPWTDLYALGLVAWHFVCGRPPYAAKSFVELGIEHMSKPLPPLVPRFDVPPHIEGWLRGMTGKEREDRFPSAAAALAALREEPWAMPPWRDVVARHRARPQRGTGLGLLGMRQVPTVGRERECDLLWEAVDRGRLGTLSVVRIDGPIGSGRSHLAEWTSQLAAECGAAAAYRVDNAAEPPLSGISGLLHAIFRSAGLEGQKLRDRVLTFSVDHRIDIDPRFAVDIMSNSAGSLTPDQVFEPTARILEGLARRQPLVLWFDDIDEAEELPRFVAYLVERHPALSATIVATAGNPTNADRARPEWDKILAHPTAIQLDLGFMSDAEVEVILRSQVDLPRRLLDQTLSRCQGSPMFAVLLLEQWCAMRDGDASRGASEPTADLPEDLREIWDSRLGHFVDDLANIRILDAERMRVASSPDRVWALLEAAATLGQRVSEAEWSALSTALGVKKLGFLVDELVRHRLARRADGGFQFVHGTLREAVVAHARTAGRSRELNRTAATVLSDLYGDGQPRLPLRLAMHLNEAGDHLTAMNEAQLAADRARDAFDVAALAEATRIWAASADAAGLAPDDARRIDLWTMQAYALLLGAAREDRAEAAALMARADQAASSGADVRARVAARRTVAALYLGDVAERAEELTRVIALPEISRETMFEAVMALARAHAALGNPQEMRQQAARAANLADNEAQRMQALQLEGRAMLELGELDAAERAIERAGQLALAHNWVTAEARGYETLAFIADARADYSTAATWHARALELFELVTPRTSYPDKQREYLARALLASGRPDLAAGHLATVREGIESGKIGFYTHIEDAELACAAAAGEWSVCDQLFDAAVAFEHFRPYEIHLRALACALHHARTRGNTDLASRIRAGLVALVGEAAAEEELEAARGLVMS